MIKHKPLEDWKLAIIYLLIYLLTIIVLSTLYSITVVKLSTSSNLEIPSLIGWIFTLLIVPAGIVVSSIVVRKKFSIKNVNQVVLYSTITYFIMELMFVIRNYFVTEINGMPLFRDHTTDIISKILTLVAFYYLSRFFLNKNEFSPK